MNKKGNVLLIILIIGIGVIIGIIYYFANSSSSDASTDILKNCYQETATQSTSCGGLATGVYTFEGNWVNQENTNDGIMSTYGEGTGDYYMYINYSKPQGALDTSKWFVADAGNKDGRMLSLLIGKDGNSTGCWDYISKILVLREHAQKKSYGQVEHECYNGQKWVSLGDYGVTYEGYKVYEEAMIWNPDSNFNLPTSEVSSSINTNSNIVKQYPSAMMSLPERCSNAKAIEININKICGALCSSSSQGYDSYDCENDRIVCNCLK